MTYKLQYLSYNNTHTYISRYILLFHLPIEPYNQESYHSCTIHDPYNLSVNLIDHCPPLNELCFLSDLPFLLPACFVVCMLLSRNYLSICKPIYSCISSRSRNFKLTVGDSESSWLIQNSLLRLVRFGPSSLYIAFS